MRKTWVSGQNGFERFFREEYDRSPADLFDASNGAEEDDSREARMMKALAHYPLLSDIPFQYLVPGESMLKENEIRFFYLDFNWIRALLDGMFSLGRSAEIDRYNDEKFIQAVYRGALNQSSDVRRLLQGKDPALLGLDETEICTGFLLRSRLVRGWRGLEFQAYGMPPDSQKPLTALRIESLSDDVLIGLYQGTIARLDISEPPEGLYHGLVSGAKGNLEVEVRKVSDGTRQEGKAVPVEVGENRVVNIIKLAADIKATQKAPGREVDGAQMALQLLRTARRLSITESE